MALKENNQKVLDYVREHEGENITLAEHKAVKFIKLTEAGRNFDENAEEVK